MGDHGPVRLIGLTGGIGTGKSEVARLLRARGVAVVDADEGARAVVEPGSEGLTELVETFGPGILDAEGRLDRPALARIVFADAAARERLNEATHPRVRAWMAARVTEAAAEGAERVVLDIPLLYEARDPQDFSAVILVYAPVETQVARLVEHRGMRPDEARARIAAQMPIEEKRARTPYVVDNSGSLEHLAAELDRVWAEVTA